MVTLLTLRVRVIPVRTGVIINMWARFSKTDKTDKTDVKIVAVATISKSICLEENRPLSHFVWSMLGGGDNELAFSKVSKTSK